MPEDNVLDEPFDTAVPPEPVWDGGNTGAVVKLLPDVPTQADVAWAIQELRAVEPAPVRELAEAAEEAFSSLSTVSVPVVLAPGKPGRTPAPPDPGAEIKELRAAVAGVVKFVQDLERQQGVRLTRLRDCLGRFGA